MRKHYKCKNCGNEFDLYDDKIMEHYPIDHCYSCCAESNDSSVESWADISYITFDKDIEDGLSLPNVLDEFGL